LVERHRQADAFSQSDDAHVNVSGWMDVQGRAWLTLELDGKP